MNNHDLTLNDLTRWSKYFWSSESPLKLFSNAETFLTRGCKIDNWIRETIIWSHNARKFIIGTTEINYNYMNYSDKDDLKIIRFPTGTQSYESIITNYLFKALARSFYTIIYGCSSVQKMLVKCLKCPMCIQMPQSCPNDYFTHPYNHPTVNQPTKPSFNQLLLLFRNRIFTILMSRWTFLQVV